MASHPLPLQGGRGWGDWSPTHPLPLQKRNAAGETRHGKRSLSRNLSPTSVGQAGGRPSRPGPREGPARFSPAPLWKECRAQWIPTPVLQQWLGDRSLSALAALDETEGWTRFLELAPDDPMAFVARPGEAEKGGK